MSDLIIFDIEKPLIPDDWNYDESVKNIKALIYKWQNMTFEIMRELWIAREKLSTKGGYQYHKKVLGTKVPCTWTIYCGDIDSSRQVINRWLKKYFSPEEQLQIQAPELPRGKYFVLYADPPWQYQNVGFDESAEQQYPTMSVEKICELPVPDLVIDKAVLFLWVTNAFLNEGLQVCQAWGFKYKTNFTWIKNSGPSIGWFTKSRHELLFIATKGEGVHPGEKFNSWFESKVKTHSKKPELTYGLIEKMYSGPYIELFARNKRKGWDSWGNEIK